VHLNNVADLFLDDDPDFVLASDYANLVKTYQFWNLEALIHGNPEMLLDHPLLEVMAVKRRIEDPLGFAWTKSNITELSPSVGLANTVIGNTNQAVHQLLEQPGEFVRRHRAGEEMRFLTGGSHCMPEQLSAPNTPSSMGNTSLRADGRRPDQLRPLRFQNHIAPYATGSTLIEWGNTRVICG